jgi:hypothetical protein
MNRRKITQGLRSSEIPSPTRLPQYPEIGIFSSFVSPSLMLHANILSYEGYAAGDLERAQEALVLLQGVVNSATFQQAVLRFDAF